MEGYLLSCLLVAALLLFSPGLPAAGQANHTVAQPAVPPGLAVEIKAPPQPATVGDAIRLDLDVSLPPGYKAETPAIDRQLGDFTVIESAADPAAQTPVPPNTTVHYRAHITVAAYRTGALEFPPVQIMVRAPDGKPITIASAPVKIEIRSVLSEKDRNLKDLKTQTEMPEPIRWGLWIGILLALAIAAAVLWILWKRRKKKIPSIPPPPPKDLLDIAEEELRQLLGHGWPDSASLKPFYVRLSDIVKRILEAGYGIHTAEQTTSEIMDVLQSRPERKTEDMERTESFLSRCDLVKFAKYVPSDGEHDAAANEARQILKLCRDLVARRESPVISETQQPFRKAEEQ